MNHKWMIFFLILIIVFSCTKSSNIPKLKFKKWYSALIDDKAIPVAENNIAGFTKGVFTSSFDVETLKNAYRHNGYNEDSQDTAKLIKDNITIKLIYVDEKRVNIMIDIKPTSK